MPNIKSAEKRVKVIEKKTLQNKMIRSQMNTVIKKFNDAVSASDFKAAEKLLPSCFSHIDHAAVSGVIHKNNANNKKSQLSKTLHSLKSGKIVVKIDAKTKKQHEQKAAGAAKKAAEADRSAARAVAKDPGVQKLKDLAAARAKEQAAKDDKKALKQAAKDDKKAAKGKDIKGLKQVEAPSVTVKNQKPDKSQKAEIKKDEKKK
jgi:small subunit ribosomal protein S20